MIRSCIVGFLGVVGLSFVTLLAVEHSPRDAYAQVNPSIASDAGVRRAEYVGDAACLSCHKEQSLSYRHTSHHLTSQPADKDSIHGTFTEGSNILMISNPEKASLDPRLYFQMEAKDGGFYQTAVAERGSQRLVRSERIDIVVGSGTRGQTYLYWSGGQLYELPVSYWRDGKQWINSPGYRDGTANFARRVDPRCLECHATYIRALSPDPQTNNYDRGSLVTGISCESCHGAGADHSEKEKSGSQKPSDSRGHAILNPAKFERDRQIDQCALCHNGTQREELVPAFSYMPGERLDTYLGPNPLDRTEHPDVHGNQVGLLKRSRCFVSSPAMTCSTCHNVHAPERSAADYSDRCLSCHRWQSCGISKRMGNKIVHDCVDCHMPTEQTNAIVSETAGRVVRTAMRNHWIKVYPGSEISSHHD
jgi:Cytochrome c554 and c-prime